MPYGTEGLLTLGGSKAAVKLWRPDGRTETLWEADFGGKFSRMRDAEVGDIYGDGKLSIAAGRRAGRGQIGAARRPNRPAGEGGFRRGVAPPAGRRGGRWLRRRSRAC